MFLIKHFAEQIMQQEESEKETPDIEQVPLQNKKAFLSRIQLSDVESLSNSVNKEKNIYRPNNTSDIVSRPSCSRVTSKQVAVSKQYLPESFSPYVQPVLEGNWDNPVHHKKMISQLAKEIVIFLNDEGLMESSDSIVRRKEYRLLEQELTTNYPKLVTYLGNESGRLKHSRKGCHSDFVKKIASRRRQEKFQINQRQREPPHNYQRSIKTMGPEDYWTLLQKMSLDELNDAAEGKSSKRLISNRITINAKQLNSNWHSCLPNIKFHVAC
ncbi:hypothetical protein Anas_09029 [Armadillidium nasatum]|uniref:Uncharacterized protein n=1 Tax=Armadillidium nasatum TaxID=96803 RepID=A0A5N5T097_9CRUS|nr:hypothetical protein Anas_09029 [Armadillidium nasatum]